MKILICDEWAISVVVKATLDAYFPKIFGDIPVIAIVGNIRPGKVKDLSPDLLIVGPGKNGQRWPTIEEARLSGIPVMVFSSRPDNEEKARALGAEFCNKPYTMVNFVKQVGKILISIEDTRGFCE